MLTNVKVDQNKIASIISLTEFKSNEEVVDLALKSYLRELAAKEVLKMKGSNFWEGDLDEMRRD